MGLRALLKGPTAVAGLILATRYEGSNHRPCGSKSISLTATLQAVEWVAGVRVKTSTSVHLRILDYKAGDGDPRVFR